MLVSASVNPEMLLNGANPDPSKPAHERDDVARLKLSQALQRAEYAIAWERAWPHLARLLTLTGLFLTVSWAGLWLSLPAPCVSRGSDDRTPGIPCRISGGAGSVRGNCAPRLRCLRLRLHSGRGRGRRRSRAANELPEGRRMLAGDMNDVLEA